MYPAAVYPYVLFSPPYFRYPWATAATASAADLAAGGLRRSQRPLTTTALASTAAAVTTSSHTSSPRSKSHSCCHSSHLFSLPAFRSSTFHPLSPTVRSEHPTTDSAPQPLFLGASAAWLQFPISAAALSCSSSAQLRFWRCGFLVRTSSISRGLTSGQRQRLFFTGQKQQPMLLLVAPI